jgi:two-component system secretion response regulator SsrB
MVCDIRLASTKESPIMNYDVEDKCIRDISEHHAPAFRYVPKSFDHDIRNETSAPTGGASRALVVDRHAIVRAGLRSLLRDAPEIQIIAEADDGLDALAIVQRQQPDIVIIELDLISMNGLDVISQITRRYDKARVIVLTSAQSEANAAKAFDAGAHAFILKLSPIATLLDAVRAVRAGRPGFLDPRLSSSEVSRLRLAGGTKQGRTEGTTNVSERGVTPRERQVLKLIAEGASNREIAERLSISKKTVETHRLNVMQKLGAHNTAELSRWALRLGLVSL